MDINQIIGVFALAFGALCLVGYGLLWSGREVKWLGKLGPMRERFGKPAGTALHFIAYVILPLVFGTLFLTMKQ